MNNYSNMLDRFLAKGGNNVVGVNTVRQLIDVLGKTIDIQEWNLGNPDQAKSNGYPRHYAIPGLDGFGLVGVDFTIDQDQKLVAIEVNGPNLAGTDSLVGHSALRSANEAGQILEQLGTAGVVRIDGRLSEPV